MSSFQNVWFMMGASVVGIVGAVGIMIITKLRQKREERMLKQYIEGLGNEMRTLRQEMENLRQLEKNISRSRRSKRSKASSVSTTSTDSFVSATDGDSSDLEFYDVSDEEDGRISDVLDITHKFADRVDLILDSGNTEELKIILEELNDLREEFPEDINILWRIARACYKLAKSCDNSIDTQNYLKQGTQACESALKMAPNNGNIHKWYAMLVGSRAELQPIKERIADGHLFKKHVDKALTLDPNDYMLHHMLGRFAYEIASLKWYERKVAAALFGEPPDGTYEEALNCFLQVEKYCNKEWKENKLYIAKCHFLLGQKSEAMKWFKTAEAVPCQNDLDQTLHAEILDMLKKCQS